MFAEQRLRTPLGIAMSDGSKPIEFQVEPAFFVGTKNEIMIRLSMKLDNTDSQHTIAPGDVVRGELVGSDWVRTMIRCSAPNSNNNMS